jgi:hypothetical protein
MGRRTSSSEESIGETSEETAENENEYEDEDD